MPKRKGSTSITLMNSNKKEHEMHVYEVDEIDGLFKFASWMTPDEVMQLCLNRHDSEVALDTMSNVSGSVDRAIEAATEGISNAHPKWKFESLEFTEGPFVSVLPNLDDGFPPENYYIVGFKIKSVPSTSQNPSESDDAYIVSPMRLGDAPTMEDDASFMKKGGETTEQKPN